MGLIDADALFQKFEDIGWYDNADRDIAEDIILDFPTADFDWHTGNPPDIEKWYLVTLKKGKDRIVSMKIWTNVFEKWGWATDADRVTAWAELPEPWEGGNE